MDQKTIDRINELYHKSKGEGLTPAEKEEQAMLRKEYIANIRANMRGTLNNISIQNEDGTITELSKLRFFRAKFSQWTVFVWNNFEQLVKITIVFYIQIQQNL